MELSDNINELAAALAAAQGEIENAAKDSANPFFKSKYADLGAVREVCRVPLSKNALALTQPMEIFEGYVVITTMLIHSSGQWMRSKLSAKPAKDDVQGIGSTATYLRRYALSAMIGIASEDDDGNAASGNATSNGGGNYSAPTKQFATGKVRKETYAKILKEINESKDNDDLAFIWQSHADDINKLKSEDPQFVQELIARKDQLKKSFSEMEDQQ